MADEDRKGRVVRHLDNSIIFEDELTGKTINLPREQVAIIYDVGVEIVSMPRGLARAKGLI
jgi:hypothetical protein